MVLFRDCVKLPIVDAYPPLRRKTRLKFFTLVICRHGDPRLLGDNMHRTDPWIVRDGIYNTCIKLFKDFILNGIPYLRV